MAAAQKAHRYEFAGPPGALAITILLPIIVYLFAFMVNDVSGCPPPSLLHPRTLKLAQLQREVGWPVDGLYGLASWRASAAVAGYYLLNALLYRLLPAVEMDGVELASGGRLKYRLNTWSSNMLILSVCLAGTMLQGAEFPVWTFISDNHIQIISANLFIAYFLATFVYIRSFSVQGGAGKPRELAVGGASGNMIYDWFIGRELNPRITLPLIGEIDIKEWCELRPGMLGWILLNLAWVAKQYRTYGYVADSIVFISAAQSIYVLDSWWYESAVLTTIDLTTDGFGFMLAFGDLTWLPFIYSVQTHYLSIHPVSLGPLGLAGITALIAGAFYIFRASNSEKNRFRTNPDDPGVAHLQYIETKQGSRLLVSGWWGTSRHINYFGDWIQAWAYCLPTGLAGYTILSAGTGAVGAIKMLDGREVVQDAARGWGVMVTYFYIVYFTVLLVHRERRDNEKCSKKYGEDWERYKKSVRWRIVPGIY